MNNATLSVQCIVYVGVCQVFCVCCMLWKHPCTGLAFGAAMMYIAWQHPVW